MLACERGVFVNLGPPNGDMSSGRGCALGAFADMCMCLLLLFIKFLAVCAVCFVCVG